MRAFISILILTLFSSLIHAGPRDEMLADALSRIPATLTMIPAGISRVAVSRIDITSNSGFESAAVEDQLGLILLESGRFQLIDRKSLSNQIEEQKLSLSGLVDSSSMAQAGRLIGVQGFFFGTLEYKNDRVILTLKLVDVTTGAIVYARKFSGFPQSFITLGAGFVYTPMAMTLTGSSTGEISAPAFGLDLSYRQGFQGLPAAQLGFDVAFVKTFSDSYEIKRMDLRPKIYLSLRQMLGWEMDYILPYAGIDLSVILWGNTLMPTAFGFFPLAGLELTPVPFLSLFIEALYMTRTQLMENGTEYLTEGLGWFAGARFQFSLY